MTERDRRARGVRGGNGPWDVGDVRQAGEQFIEQFGTALRRQIAVQRHDGFLYIAWGRVDETTEPAIDALLIYARPFSATGGMGLATDGPLLVTVSVERYSEERELHDELG